ncbi:multicopper oxidase family protein [Naasia sp. SYSU D00948]|uniref:multicopper oxidase family protein n=1 Tax=Naasia sp. SYSU D00948 TaxID=2817379 RepID=UPI001B3069B0|nr:multicopper oxidase family protein [Naasia sp. SYSU D00948]
MSTSLLLLLDLAVGALCAAAWIGAAVLAAMPAARRRTTATASLAGLGVLLALGQLGTGLLLAARGWGFAQEKLVFAVPLQLAVGVAAAAIAVPALLRARSAPLPALAVPALVGAAASAAAGILARVLIGYPLSPLAAVGLALLVPLAVWLTWAVLRRERRQLIGASALVTLLLAGSLGFAWLTDVAAPGALSSHAHAAAAAPDGVSVTDLRTPADAPGTLRHFDLTARHETVTSPGGTEITAQSFGSLPGPELRVAVGDLVEVTLRNEDIEDGVTLHWHGYDVPNGEDGVAGATQDPVLPGESFTYRFVADEPGTYWYHTHQSSAEGIRRGLFGMLVVLPADGILEAVDLTVPLHTFGSSVWLGEADTHRVRETAEGSSVRLRFVNTDQVPHRFRVTGAAFRVVAVDGRDVPGGTEVTDSALRVPAGGRIDVALEVPYDGVLVTTDASTRASLALAPEGSDPSALEAPRGLPDLDLHAYGDRAGLVLPERMTEETLVLDRLPRVFGGLPANAYVVNGAVFPHIPNIEVTEGQVLKLTVLNRGRDTHPMHIHGHHVLVLSRNGVPATGAPLWLDTFDVEPGDSWEVMLVADNPGIWMDHCHNLDHAEQGMVMAIAYDGVTTPFEHKQISG